MQRRTKAEQPLGTQQPEEAKVRLKASGNNITVGAALIAVVVVVGLLVPRPWFVGSADRNAIAEARPGAQSVKTAPDAAQQEAVIGDQEAERPPQADSPGGHAVPSVEDEVHEIGKEHENLNAVITVVARGSRGTLLARWRARGHWAGTLPARFHGSRSTAAWRWNDPAARDIRLPARAEVTEGVPVEIWALRHGALTVDIAIDRTTGSLPVS